MEHESHIGTHDIDLPGETRYRTSQYFQADRLQRSEAVADFRAVKSIVAQLQQMKPMDVLQTRQLQKAYAPVYRQQ